MPEPTFQTRLLDPVKTEPYDPTDYKTVRQRLLDNTRNAFTQRFPLENDKYVLSVDGLEYDKYEPTLRDEKQAILRNASITKKLKGQWVLTDKATGQVKRSNPRILMNVPYLTRRGTFIRNGSEQTVNYMFRLVPGVYSRQKDNGLYESHINPKQGTGGQFKIELDPKSGIFRVRKGTRGYKMYPLLKRAGVTDDQIKKMWGAELLASNREASDVPNPEQKYIGGVSKQASDASSKYDELLESITKAELDPVATEITLGKRYDRVTPETMLDASAKVLRMSRGEEEGDYRDSLEFQKIDGPADYFAERIVRDGGGIARNLLWRVSKNGSFDDLPTAPMNKHVDAIFNEANHSSYVDGSSLIAGIDGSTRISRIGEGGISSVRTAPSETRAVQDTFAGFIDPVRSVDSLRVGLDMHMTEGVRKGDDGRLYTRMLNAKTGEEEWVDSLRAARSNVATKKEYAAPGSEASAYVPAVRGSKGIGIVPREEVDYYIMDPKNMFSLGANSVPGKNGIMANRLHMGSKFENQSMPLVHREAPLVQGRRGTGTHEEAVGAKLGVERATNAGRVVSIDADKIVIRGVDGTQEYELYDNHPFNQKGYLRSIPQVKVGDEVKPEQVLATTNYTDDKGIAAQGTNLRTAFMPWKGLNYEDSLAISESAARKLAAEKMYKKRMPVSSNTDFSKKAFVGKFPSKFTKDQLRTIGDNGIVKKGTVLRYGDPMIVAVRQNEPKPGSLGRKTMTALTETWDHKYEGIVADTEIGDRQATVYTRANIPMRSADKLSNRFANKGVVNVLPDNEMPLDADGNPIDVVSNSLGVISRCYDKDTEFLTNHGWRTGAEVRKEDRLLCYDTATGGMAFLEQKEKMYAKQYTGKMYGFCNDAVDFLVTPGHRFWARTDYPDAPWRERRIEDIYGKHYYVPSVGTGCATGSNGEEEAEDFILPHLDYHIKDTSSNRQEICIPAKLWARLLGWFVAEGNVDDKTHIAQCRDANYEQWKDLDDLLKQLPFAYWYSLKNRQFHITSKRLCTYLGKYGKCYEKFVDEWVFRQPSHIRREFIEGYWLGDGRGTYGVKPANQASVAGTTSKRLADDIHALIILDGEPSRRHDKPAKPKQCPQCNERPLWRVTHHHGRDNTRDRLLRDGWYTKDYNDMVYCPTVSTGYVLTRRNGKTLCAGNTNPVQVVELMAGKLARHTGKPEVLDSFSDEDMILKYEQKLKDAGLQPNEDLYDPATGRKIPQVLTGDAFYYRLMHLAEDKGGARGVGPSTGEDTPLRGGSAGAKQMGGLHTSALVGHGAMQVIKDAKMIRGMRNDDFWRDFRMGRMPRTPGRSLVNEKFYAHLKGAGINIDENSDRVNFFGMTNEQARKLAKGHELGVARTFDQKTMRPIDGGLFDPKLFGANGDDWAFIQLDEPLPNPVMEPALASILKLTQKDFNAIMAGDKEIGGKTGGAAIMTALQKIDMKTAVKDALTDLKSSTPSKKDKALKRYRFLKSMEQQDVTPADFMMERIPVLPPKFRPVTQAAGTNITADANVLYRSMLFARDDLREAKDKLPDKQLGGARKQLYSTYKALTGMYDPDDAKLEEKNVQGLLKWVLGKGSSKYGAYHRRVLGTAMNIAGRGVITPNPALKLNQVGLPIKQAWDVYEPFIVRDMVRTGYTPTEAIRMVKDRSDKAFKHLQAVVKDRPVIVNRAPSLHKYSVMAFEPQLVKGDTVQISPSIVGPYGADFDGDQQISEVIIAFEKKVCNNPLEMIENMDMVYGKSPLYWRSRIMPFIDLNVPHATEHDFFAVDLEDFPHTTECVGTSKKGNADFYTVPEGVKVVAFSEQSGMPVLASVRTWSRHTNNEVWLVDLVNNRQILTDDDERAVYGLVKGTVNEYARRRPKDAGDILIPCVSDSSELFKTTAMDSVVLPQSKGERYVLRDVLELTRDAGYFLGAAAGDGWVSGADPNKPTQYSISGIHDDVISAVKKALDAFVVDGADAHWGGKATIDSHGESYTHVLSCTALAPFISECVGRGAENKHLPSFWAGAPREFKMGLLSGLLDTDGSVCILNGKKVPQLSANMSSTSLRLLRDTQGLLLSLGVRSSLSFGKTTTAGLSSWTLAISSVELYAIKDELCCSKQLILDSFRDAPPPSRVIGGYQKMDRVPITRELIDSYAAREYATCPPRTQPGQYGNTPSKLYTSLKEAGKQMLISRDRAIEAIEKFPDIDAPAEWAALVYNKAISWTCVKKATRTGAVEIGYDLCVPGFETFMNTDGVILSNTVTYYVPVSKDAVEQARSKMLPTQNLLSPRNMQAHYTSGQEFVQGLYLATRAGKGKPTKTFRTVADAQKAFNAGQIDIDTPITILETE